MSERDLRHSIDAFEQQLSSVKTRINGVSWYPYSTFSSFRILPRLIGGEYQHLLKLIGEGPIVDVGCGDGSIAFRVHSGFAASESTLPRDIGSARKRLDSSINDH
jgi:hypothetical protein